MERKRWRRAAALFLGGMLLETAAAGAYPIRTPAGGAPLVHWAVVRSVPGRMADMQALALRLVAPEAAKEPGTYALYGGVDAAEPEVLRLLEIYENEAAYERHVGSEAFRAYREARAPILADLRLLPAVPIALEQKARGAGTCLSMTAAEAAPEACAAYRALWAAEAARAVREEAGVLGFFVTAEPDAPHRIHTLEIYLDEDARAAYRRSAAWQAFRRRAASMERFIRGIQNRPARIALSAKGLAVRQEPEGGAAYAEGNEPPGVS